MTATSQSRFLSESGFPMNKNIPVPPLRGSINFFNPPSASALGYVMPRLRRFPVAHLAAQSAAEKNPRHFDSTPLTISPRAVNTGNVMAVSPGTSGLQYRSLTTDIGDTGGNSGPRQAHFWLSGLSVAQRISIRNALCQRF